MRRFLARGVRGVRKVRPLILQRSEEKFGWIDDAIEERTHSAALM